MYYLKCDNGGLRLGAKCGWGKPGSWHNGSEFVFCPGDCRFESEPNPTSTDVNGELTGCDARCQQVSRCSTRVGS